MRVDMRDVHSLEQDANFTRVLTDMIGAAVFWEGRLCVVLFALSLSRLVSCGPDGSAEAETDAPAWLAAPGCWNGTTRQTRRGAVHRRERGMK